MGIFLDIVTLGTWKGLGVIRVLELSDKFRTSSLESLECFYLLMHHVKNNGSDSPRVHIGC